MIYFLVIALAIIIGYLLLANYLIYYRIHHAGFITPDTKYDYTLTASKINSAPLVYAALGDSLTSGVGVDDYQDSYPYLLAQKMSQGKNYQVELKTFSYPGARTFEIIKDLLGPAIAAKPDVVTVLIGVNDIHGRIGLQAFENNYDYILNKLTKETGAKIYLIGLPALGTADMLPPFNYYFEKQTDLYNEAIKSLAKKYDLQFIDLNGATLSRSKKDDGYYARDSFHPSANGYRLWAQIIYDNINN